MGSDDLSLLILLFTLLVVWGTHMKIKNIRPIESFCSTLIVIMTLIIIYRVFMRFVFNNTPSWSEELTALFMVYITLLSFPLGIKEDRHLCLSMFYDKMPKPLQLFFTVFNYAVLLFFSGYVMVYNGLLMVRMTSTSSLSSLPLKNSILYSVMPIAGILSLLFIIKRIIKDIRSSRICNSKEGTVHGTD
jgi:TRAP-type transport system small permease protein